MSNRFIFPFCKPFFACDASNLVEKTGLKIAYEYASTPPQNMLRNTVYPSTLEAFILYDKNILFYQKTAKELLICQPHFIFRFCTAFFDCDASNLVENMELKIAYECTATRRQKSLRNTVTQFISISVSHSLPSAAVGDGPAGKAMAGPEFAISHSNSIA